MSDSTQKHVSQHSLLRLMDGTTLNTVSDQDLRNIIEEHKKWLESEGKEGKKADLQQTNLNGVQFEGASLAYANLQKASLQHANLEASNLRGANLVGANFRNAIIRDADLSDVVGLESCSLAGADLSNAKLPRNIAQFDALSQVGELSKNARTTFFAVLASCVYSWLTIATTTDAALLVNTTSSSLPIIYTKVPIAGFYWAAPAILLSLYLYLHLYLQNLWRAIASLPAKFPDGRALDEHAYPWLLISLVRSHMPRLMAGNPPFSRLTVLLSIVSAWMLVPATLAIFWVRYLPRCEWTGTNWHVTILVISVCSGVAFYRHARITLRGDQLPAFTWSRLWHISGFYTFVGIVLFLGTTAVIISDGVINGIPEERKAYVEPYIHRLVVPKFFRFLGYIPFLDLEEEELSDRPDGWGALDNETPSQIAQVQKARLKNRSLRYANLEGAFLVKADLTGVDLSGANLQHADLRGARLWGASLEGAVVHQANFQGAEFRSTNLDGVILHSTKYLTQHQLRNACSNMAQNWLPKGLRIKPCPKDQDWPKRSKAQPWPLSGR